MTTGLPLDDPARLGALRRYGILDTPRERDFDTIVALAAAICEAPIAGITLLDAERQWFKAEVGLDTCEMPIQISICAQLMTDEGAIVEINDTLLDPRTRNNPLCQGDEGMRFYAGAVLKSSEGHVLGRLCVIDCQPRVLTSVQRQAIIVLGAQVMAQIELRAALCREMTLRRETDHRVKNSLASVASFVRLRQNGSNDAGTREDLRAVGQQIQSVELLHRQFCHSDTTEVVALGDYLQRITALLDATVPAGIIVTGSFADVDVATSVATAIGTIVNELVANAIKHGFGPGGDGRIALSGNIAGDGLYRLACRDDAPCLAVAPTANEREGLGLRIIAALIKQIGGNLTRTAAAHGYQTTIAFPVTMAPGLGTITQRGLAASARAS